MELEYSFDRFRLSVSLFLIFLFVIWFEFDHYSYPYKHSYLSFESIKKFNYYERYLSILNLNKSYIFSDDDNQELISYPYQCSYLVVKNESTNFGIIPSFKKWYNNLPNWKNAHLSYENDDSSYPTTPFIKRMRIIDDFDLLETLGAGGYGTVRLAVLKDDPFKYKYVIKRVPKRKIKPDRWISFDKQSLYFYDSPASSSKLMRLPVEAGVLFHLRSLNFTQGSNRIIKLEEYLEDRYYYYLVFEWLSNAIDISHFVKSLTESFLSEFDARMKLKHIIWNIFKAVTFLHDNDIVHGDIKDENILLYGPFQDRVKLIDFGSSLLVLNDSYAIINEYKGGSKFKSPQVVRKSPFNGFKQDAWSLGVLVYFMTFHRFPFLSDKDVIMSDPSFDFEKKHFISKELIDLIKKLLTKNEKRRPHIRDLLCTHPFFIDMK